MIEILYFRAGSRAAATSKMEHFVVIVNDFQPLTIITKRSILDVAAAVAPPLLQGFFFLTISHFVFNFQSLKLFA